MIQQLADRMARIETRNMDDESFDGEQEDNPFHHRAPLGESDERGRGGRPFNNDTARYFDMKVDIPEFEGKIRPDEFIDWLNSVERIFDYKEVPDEKKVKIVAIKLKKHASAWWEQLRVRRERLGKPKIRTWEKMKKELKKKFLPDTYRQNNFLKLHNLRQGTRSIDEYTEEFDLLTMRCGVTEEEEQTVARYLGGMRREIHDVVSL